MAVRIADGVGLLSHGQVQALQADDRACESFLFNVVIRSCIVDLGNVTNTWQKTSLSLSALGSRF